VIVFRQVDGRYPFLWEDSAQPPGRWHAAGEGPAHYFADTPDGAWAEFLRHEEITDPEDVPTIRRQLWAVDIGEAPATTVKTPAAVARGGPETYAPCQDEARTLRARGVERIAAPSAALVPGGAGGLRPGEFHGGAKPSILRDGKVIVLFGSPARIIGWLGAADGHPAVDLLERVNHYPR
jgi:hypothetical protein